VDVYLHIGVGKTGTTAAETALAEASGGLAEAGMRIPVCTRRERGRHILLSAYARDAAAFERLRGSIGEPERDQDAFRKRLEAALRDELDGYPRGSKLICMDVGLCSIRTEVEAARLRDLFAPLAERVFLLVYLRRQDRFAVSRFHQDLKAGAADLDILKPRHFIDYEALLARWSAVFGRDRMIVRLYEPSHFPAGDVTADILAACGVDPGVLPGPAARANTSMAPEAERLLHGLNLRLGKPELLADRQARRPFFDRLARARPGSGLRPARREAEAFFAAYAASNEAVRTAWFPERTHLFDMDFSDYPEDMAAEGAGAGGIARLADEARAWPEADAAGFAEALAALAASS
jgi:hypothetical protein